MKIVRIIGALPIGGAENMLLSSAGWLQNCGLAETLVVNISGQGDKQQEFKHAGIPVACLGNSHNCTKTHRFDITLKLRSLLKRYRPDIIHTHLFPGNYFGCLAAIGLKRPIITHVHNTVSDAKERLRHTAINYVLASQTDLFLNVSAAVKNYTDKKLNFRNKPSKILYNAFDPAQTNVAARLMFPAECKVIIQVGAMVESKNHLNTIKAFAALSKRCPQARLLLVGDGPMKARLQQMTRCLALENLVKFTGWQSNVFPYLKAAHIFVLPSLHEGFANAALGAMACGLPLVVSHNVPLEIAQDSALVCDINAESIAEKLLLLLQDKARHQQLSAKAQDISAGFHLNNYCRALLNIYRQLLA